MVYIVDWQIQAFEALAISLGVIGLFTYIITLIINNDLKKDRTKLDKIVLAHGH